MGTGDIEYAMIFNDGEDGIWMGKYENGTVREFSTLSDYEGVYMDLPLSKFAFVSVQEGTDDQVWIKDICTFVIGKAPEADVVIDSLEEGALDEVPVTYMMEELNFPSDDTDMVFRGFFAEAGKMN